MRLLPLSCGNPRPQLQEDGGRALSESREEKVPAKKWEPCPKCGDETGEPECDRCDGRGVVPAESREEKCGRCSDTKNEHYLGYGVCMNCTICGDFVKPAESKTEEPPRA